MAIKVFARGYLLCLVAATCLHHSPDVGVTAFWAVAQWLPGESRRWTLLDTAWRHWEQLPLPTPLQHGISTDRSSKSSDNGPRQLEIPVLDVQKHRDNLLEYLEKTYGSDWRRRPLLLRNLWTKSDLQTSTRKLSLSGLLQERLSVPYFSDARVQGALAPDRTGRIQDIVRNITQQGAPHKIGTQHLVQTYPELIREVAPHNIVTRLFGNHFEPASVTGSGPFAMFPATTTVPVFVAKSSKSDRNNNKARPFTGLHCEPIGNVAVQLSGQKQWTLVSPEYSRWIRPSLATDGRAFFASHADSLTQNDDHDVDFDLAVPVYSAITKAGDAMWVPTWTWHRVDYVASKDIAIGGSLFHF